MKPILYSKVNIMELNKQMLSYKPYSNSRPCQISAC